MLIIMYKLKYVNLSQLHNKNLFSKIDLLDKLKILKCYVVPR